MRGYKTGVISLIKMPKPIFSACSCSFGKMYAGNGDSNSEAGLSVNCSMSNCKDFL